MIVVKEIKTDKIIGIFKTQAQTSKSLGLSYAYLRKKKWDGDTKQIKGYILKRIDFGLFSLPTY